MNFWNRSHSNLQTTKEIWDEKDGRVCLVQHFTALPTLFLTEKKRTLHNMTIFTNTYISNLVSGLFTADIKLHKLTQLLSRTLHVHFIKTKDNEFTAKWIRWDNRCRVFFLNSASHDIWDSIYDLCQQDLAVVLSLHRVQDQ